MQESCFVLGNGTEVLIRASIIPNRFVKFKQSSHGGEEEEQFKESGLSLLGRVPSVFRRCFDPTHEKTRQSATNAFGQL